MLVGDEANGNLDDDPKVSLAHYYQKLSPPITISFKTNLKDYNDAPPSFSSMSNQYWRSEFSCPITKQVHHSSLNYLDIIESSSCTTVNLEQQQQQEFIISDDHVYFRTKKTSQKAAAKVALDSLTGQPKTMFRSSKEVWKYQHPDEEEQQHLQSPIHMDSFLMLTNNDDDNSSIEDDDNDEHQKKLPLHDSDDNGNNTTTSSTNWADIMRQLGITSPNHFYMSFAQVFLPNDGSNKRSTYIRCCIDTFFPKRLTAWGAAAKSKTDAILSALALLEEVIMNDGRKKKNTGNASSILSKFKKHVPTICQYHYSLLPCFTQPIVTTTSSSMFLYELKFNFINSNNISSDDHTVTNNTPSLASHLCGFEQGITAMKPLGILFPMDVMPYSSSSNSVAISSPLSTVHTTFSLGCNKNNNNNTSTSTHYYNKNVCVQLTRRTRIDTITQHQLDVAKHFHDTMDLWKHYGLLHQKPSNRSNSLEKTLSPMDRTYLLVPLIDTNNDHNNDALQIDWNLLNQLFNCEETPYLQKQQHAHHGSPYFDVTVTLMLVLVLTLICRITTLILCQKLFLLLILIVLLLRLLFTVFIIRKNKKKTPIFEQVEYSKNKFLVHEINGTRTTYIPCNTNNSNNINLIKSPTDFLFDETTTKSSQDALTSEKREAHLRKYNGLDLVTATYVDYYYKKYGIDIQYKNVPLIPVHIFHNTSKTTNTTLAMHIVPELTKILPLPRDILCMSRYRSSFFTSLEIAISLSHVESWLRDRSILAVRSNKMSQVVVNTSSYYNNKQQQRQRRRPSLAECLKDALYQANTNANAFQRLEFVGDAVLGFYTAINLFSRNASLHWNVEDLEQFLAHAVKNVTLFDAALNVGIPSLIITRDATKWQSSYSRVREVSDFKCHPVSEISDKTISDTVEALLGAIYLGCTNEEEGGCMLIGFLNELDLPLKPPQRRRLLLPDNTSDIEEVPAAKKDHWTWLTAHGACIQEGGYPFKLDQKWLAEIVNIGTIIYLEHDVANLLDAGRIALLDVFASKNDSSTIDVDTSTKHSEILLFTALFDDSLCDENDEEERSFVTSSSAGGINSSFTRSEDSSISSSIRKGEEATGVVRVALFRDTLFIIGNYALMLCLAEECYDRYPNATEGDMHTLRMWAFSNDVMAYLMVKNGIHDCLYDKHARATAKFSQRMAQSDALGEKNWSLNGGWILPGGLEEYQRRCEANGQSPKRAPTYVGLAYGQLVGTQKKLPLDLTGDLVFSMKSICGALVLSFGLKPAWKHFLLPLFEELLLISPAELTKESADATFAVLPSN